MNKFILLFAVCACVSFPVAAKTYKWVDDKGVTHMGDTIPPEYANKDRQLLNKSGIVIKTQDVLTPEERRAQEAESAKHHASENAARDQKLHDRSLTDTYSNVKEIELSRSRNIQQVEARINSIQAQLKSANSNLSAMQGKHAPAEEIKQAQERVMHLQRDLDKYQAEKLAIEARYDADKTRYQELTGK